MPENSFIYRYVLLRYSDGPRHVSRRNVRIQPKLRGGGGVGRVS